MGGGVTGLTGFGPKIKFNVNLTESVWLNFVAMHSISPLCSGKRPFWILNPIFGSNWITSGSSSPVETLRSLISMSESSGFNARHGTMKI